MSKLSRHQPKLWSGSHSSKPFGKRTQSSEKRHGSLWGI